MNNPILNAMRQNNMTGAIGQIRQIMQTVRAARDPQAALNMVLKNNPNYRQAMQLVQQAGGDAGKAFRDLAKQNGIDPEEILRGLM